MAEKTIAESIADAGRDGIQTVSVDGTRVEAMTIDDQIKADQYAKTNTAAGKNHLGITFRRFKPGGCGE